MSSAISDDAFITQTWENKPWHNMKNEWRWLAHNAHDLLIVHGCVRCKGSEVSLRVNAGLDALKWPGGRD